MVKKKFPWHADINNFVAGYSVVDRDIQHLKDLNINVIRLGKLFVMTLQNLSLVLLRPLGCCFLLRMLYIAWQLTMLLILSRSFPMDNNNLM